MDFKIMVRFQSLIEYNANTWKPLSVPHCKYNLYSKSISDVEN